MPDEKHGAGGQIAPQCAWEAASQLAAIVESSRDAIIGKAPDGTIRSWNRAAERLYGYAASEVIGQPISIIIPPEHAGEDREILARVLAGEPIEHFETRRVRKDGSYVSVSLSASAVRDAAGEIVGASVIARDVSDRVAADVVRRELDVARRFRAAFTDAPVGMALVSVDSERFGMVLETNPALCATTGHTDCEIVQSRLQSLAHDDDRTRLLQTARAVASGELRTGHGEIRLLHAAGQPLWVSLSLSLMRDADDRPLHLLVLVQEITERKLAEHELRHLADHDPLTGLFNRRHFVHELERQVSYVQRYGTQAAVVLLDLDHFKRANDSFGHKAGDDLIAAVGRVLRERLRKTDLIGRLGGDEFALVLPEVELEIATMIVEDVLQQIRSDVRVEGSDTRFTASAGIALVAGPTELAGEQPLVAADLAMYEAKRAGRDRLAVYGPELQQRTRSRRGSIERIREALEGNKLLLYDQPILDLRTGGIEQHELLIRMHGPDGEIIPAGGFLDVAERFGLIEAIDRWVVAQAIDLLEREARTDLCLEINLSARSVTDPRIPLLVEQAVVDRRLDPSKLIFEVSETVAIANVVDARRFADRIRGLGCRFALDNFGAGFGSFYCFKHLPFDYIKIDGEFITRLLTGTTDQLVVRALVEVARGLGMRTIAEFVGDEDTVALLRSYGVDYAQGFHVGHPWPIGEVLAPITARSS